MIAAVDGCKGGWIAAIAERWNGPRGARFVLCADFGAVLEATRECAMVVVDMPIGLPEGPEPREADVAARAISHKPSSIFLAPPRATLAARTPAEFQRLHRRITGRGAGLPVWGIVPKMREVDALLTPAHAGRVREFHPELAWERLAGRLLAPKRSAAGALERIRLLDRHYPAWAAEPVTLQPRGRTLALDDLLDAAVGLRVAQGIIEETAHRAPDDRGGAAIWY
jgi:predicted RNase H-like nuclease